MKIVPGWAVVVFCFCAYPLWAGPTPVVEVKQGGGPSVNVGPVPGLSTDNPALGNTTTLPKDVNNVEDVPALERTPSPAIVSPQVDEVMPSNKVNNPASSASKPAVSSAKPAQPKTSLTKRVSGEVEKFKAPEAGEMADFNGLNRLFDNLRAGAGKSALAAVPGKLMEIEDNIKRNVRLAGASRPQDAPGLYAKAVQIAQSAYPKEVARRIREIILEEHAIRKAKPSLLELFNEAYQAAVAGEVKAKDEAVASIGKWAALFQDSKFAPLVVNIQARKDDLALVLEEGRRSPLSQGDAALLSVSIEPSDLSFLVLPPVRRISPLAESMAMPQAVPAFRGWLESRLSPWSVFAQQRRTGRSLMGSARAAASYFWAWVWHAIKDAFLRLIGRGRVDEISRGFSVAAQPALLERGILIEPPVKGIRANRMEPLAPSWWAGKFAAMAEFEENAAAVESLLSRQAPEAGRILDRAQAMAAACDRITGESSASAGAAEISRRVKTDSSRAKDLVLGPESLMRYWVSRMESDARGFILGLPGRAAANVLLSGENGKRLAVADLGRRPGSGLRAAARVLLDASSAPEGSFVTMDNQFLARWTKNGRSVKIYANVVDPGGVLRVLVEDAQGIFAAADALSVIGFSVEVRGKELAASWEKASAVEQALDRAVNVLQFGSDPGSGVLLAGEAAQGLARLADDLQKRRGQAADVARVVQARVPGEALRRLVGGIDGFDVFAGRFGPIVIYALKGPNDRWSAARAELNGKVLSVSELKGRLPKE